MTDTFWRVRLPAAAHHPIEVFIDGVLQTEGEDYRVQGREILFQRELVKEGKVSGWRWLIGAFGIGTYKRNDEVDIRYSADGQTVVASGLEIEPPANHL